MSKQKELKGGDLDSKNDKTSIVPKQQSQLPVDPNLYDNLIEDEKILGVYENILDQVQQDREEISEILNNFLNMVTNDGDSTSATKEAVVSLMKAKLDAADKQAKIADLMTRIKLKERNTMPRYLAQQQNVYNFGKSEDEKKQLLLGEIDKASKKDK